MLLQLEQHLSDNFSFLKEKKLLITVSGGIDSVVLAHVLTKLNYNISIAHCNFQLRGQESDLDETFVKDVAKQLNCEIHTTKFDTTNYCKTQKVSTQIGARQLRYQWFQQLCTNFNLDYILTGHHLNDVMETFLINLSRGSGIEGLTGIPAINKNIIRPLLPFSRTDIEAYAQTNNILWREDKSNAETKYIRNKIRHLITPELYNLHADFEENFKKSIDYLSQSKTFIHQKIEELKKELFKETLNGISIQKEKIEVLSEFEIHEIFYPFGFTSVLEIKKILKAQTGKEIHSATHSLLNNREDLILCKHTQTKDKDSYIINNIEDLKNLPIALDVSYQKRELDKNTIAIDPKKTSFPLRLRKRKEGDVFSPIGMMGKKKVSKYFKDEKLSKIEKDNTWILCTKEDKIIWIIGLRADKNECEYSAKENLIFISKL
ncbi:tRNA lysidine(34) synthetase TilS [Wenyingzhuangia sp. IMCC45574]